MKTTVRLDKRTRMTVQPAKDGAGLSIVHEVKAELLDAWYVVHTSVITPDQAGALIFGMEQALETQEVARQRAGA